MSKHVSYRGKTIDMESMSRENAQVPAVGNLRVNARGDQIKGGQVTKTADQIARENHRVQSVVVSTGLKGKQPVAATQILEQPKPEQSKPAKATKSITKEVELPSGDIVVEGDNNAS